MELDALTKVKKARAAMLIDQPFYGELALKLILKEDYMLEIPEEHKRTCWVDGVTLGFNPDFVNRCDMPLLYFVVSHEVMHCVLSHNLRRDGRDPEMWNEACDYAINAILKKSGCNLPSSALYSEEFENKPAEDIFYILKGRKQKEQEEQKQQQQPSPSEDKSEDSDDKSDDKGEGEDNQPSGDGAESAESDEEGEGQGEGQPGEESAKNGKSGGAGEGEGHGDPGGCGEVRDYPGEDGEATGDEKAAQQQEWQMAASSAAVRQEGIGNDLGYIKQVVDELKEGKVDWREVLQRFVNEHSRNDYSWRRSNARYIHTGFILPSLNDEQLPPIGFAIDTSGSTSEDLSQFAAEAEEVLAAYPTTLQVVMADTEVRSAQEYSREDVPLHLEFAGGGGTKFEDTFRHFNELDVPPICVVYLTDLDCYEKHFGPEPDYPVLWIQTEGDARKAPWGEVVRMHKRF